MKIPTSPLFLLPLVAGLFAFSGRRDHDQARLAFLRQLRPHYPADHTWLLTNLGWDFLSPEQALLARGGKADEVVLRQVLRTELKKRTFTFAGKDYPLSDKAIDNLVADACSPALNECLFGHQTRQKCPPGGVVAGISWMELQ